MQWILCTQEKVKPNTLRLIWQWKHQGMGMESITCKTDKIHLRQVLSVMWFGTHDVLLVETVFVLISDVIRDALVVSILN